MSATWKVLPHEPIDKLTPDLWRVQGALPNMPMQRVMTVARMSDGRLVIHSGIALEEEAMHELEGWGLPAFLIVPNGYHRMDAPAYRERYPDITVLCPSGSRARVEKLVKVDGGLEDFPDDERVAFEYLAGIRRAEGVMRVDSDDGVTLVCNDVLFNMPHVSGVSGFVLRRITQSSGGPRISRLFRWLAVKDRAALRADLQRLAETPDLVRIVVSHHEVITDDPAGTLRRVAATL